MDEQTRSPRRGVLDRLRGARGLVAGVAIGAVAFGASTAGAGPSGFADRGGSTASIEEECREICDQEEVKEYVWGEGLTEYILEGLLEAPRSPSLKAAPTP